MVRNILLTGLVIWLGLMGVICGCLFLVCLLLLVLWQGLGVSAVVLGFACLAFVALAFVMTKGLRRPRVTEERRGFSIRDWIRQKLFGESVGSMEEISQWQADGTGYDEWVSRGRQGGGP